MKDKRDDKAEREEQLRRRFEHQLRPLTSGKTKSHIEFPKTLNAYERAMAHEVAKALGLKHESRGALFALIRPTSCCFVDHEAV